MKRLSLILFLFSLFNLFSPFPSEAARRALLIGINDYKNLPYYSKEQGKWITNLKGPLNDIRIMKQILISRYGFLEGDILLLKDHEATRDNILKKFKDWLIQGSREGDTVLFFFSGHGAQVNDQNGDEEDGLDEAFCPYDTVPEGARTVMEARLILDDELGLLLRELRGREVVGIVDSCHSGTMTRGIRGAPVSELEPTPAYQARFIPVKIEASYVRGGGFSLDLPRQEDVPEGQIFLSASRENQLSLEMTLPDGVHGAFTHGLVEGMEKIPGATYLKLYEYARKVVKDRYRLEQDPQIEPKPPGGKILARVAFSPPPAPSRSPGRPGGAQAPIPQAGAPGTLQAPGEAAAHAPARQTPKALSGAFSGEPVPSSPCGGPSTPAGGEREEGPTENRAPSGRNAWPHGGAAKKAGRAALSGSG